MNKNKIIALMPLKAHSARVPGKNFKDLNGRPLFSWMLDKLIESEHIDTVVINTDARRELVEAGLVESPKVQIRDRRVDLCGDEVSMNLILKDDLDNTDADMYLMTHTTNPFLSLETIDGAIDSFVSAVPKVDSLFTVNRMQTRFYDDACKAINHDPDNLIPTQDLAPWFEENSCLYLFTRSSFETSNARIGSKPMMYETKKLESVDIDEQQDWEIAEVIASYFKKNNRV